MISNLLEPRVISVLFRSRLRVTVLLVSLLAGLALPFGLAKAQDNGGAIARGFAIDGTAADFVSGALVSTKDNSASVVQLATKSTAKRLVGIVNDQPLVSLSGSDNARTQVATSGIVQALVSDINGSIRAGDKITASPIAGVGMLASGSDQVVGTAQTGLNTETATAHEVADNKGSKRTVHLGRVPLQVGVAFYQAPTSGAVPPFVQILANNIAGRQVSLARILVCTTLLLAAVVSAPALLYAAARSGLISLGRNPMAAGAIRHGLLQVGTAIVLILGLALLASYIILTV